MSGTQQSAREEKSGAAPRRRRVGKFLVVVDDTPESRVALRFAAFRAQRTGARVTLLRVIEPGDFQHWMAVRDLMREEAQAEAENLLQSLAAEVGPWVDHPPELVIREGKKKDEVLKLIDEDPLISVLVLGAAPGSEGPGPLVNSLAGQMSGGFNIPITIVPGTLTDERIDELT